MAIPATDPYMVTTEYSLPGHTSHQIAGLAARVIEHLFYSDVAMTFDVIADLHETAQAPDERELWLKSRQKPWPGTSSTCGSRWARVQALLVDR